MFNAFKNVILSGNYELADIKSRIAIAWAGGEITTEQRAELDKLAEEHADPTNSYAPLQARLDEAFAQIAALNTRVTALENGGNEGGEDVPGEEYPAFVQPTGSHDAYKTGDKITYNGKHYECIAPEGVAVVWSPEVMPGYWSEVA